MSNSVIIIGAGASFDYIPNNDIRRDGSYQPPMANGLFSRQFERFINLFPEVYGLSAGVATAIRNGSGLEDYLLKVQGFAAKNKDRQQQINAMSFYLQKLFREVTINFGNQSSNNYTSLVNYIKDSGGNTTVINFNYDLLFEEAVGYQFDKVDSYIANPIKIIKVHGAYNWIKILSDEHGYLHEIGNSYKFLMQEPWYLTRIKPSDDTIYIRDVYQQTVNSREFYYYPIIAIPVTGKNTFVCPEKHILSMTNALQEADKLLIIGWKAADSYLIKIMEEVIKKSLNTTVVSGTEKGIKEIQGRLSHIKNISFGPTVTTFSSFVGSSACEDFFT